MSRGLLRDAADPKTPGEHLKWIVQHGSNRAQVVALGNPSLPLGALASVLTFAPRLSHAYSEAAWRNPSVVLAMMVKPSPEYPMRALALLRALEDHHKAKPLLHSSTLAEACEAWAKCKVRSADHDHVRAFARHLATLFSIPWSEP